MAARSEFCELPRKEPAEPTTRTSTDRIFKRYLQSHKISSYIRRLIENVRPDSISKQLAFGLGLVEIFQDLLARRTKLGILCHNSNDILSDRLTQQERLHSLDIDVALVCETNLPTYFVRRNSGYRTYKIRGPNPFYRDTAVLVKSKHAMLKSFQASAISVELHDFTVLVNFSKKTILIRSLHYP